MGRFSAHALPLLADLISFRSVASAVSLKADWLNLAWVAKHGIMRDTSQILVVTNKKS